MKLAVLKANSNVPSIFKSFFFLNFKFTIIIIKISCKQSYPRESIEARLVAVLQKRTVAYQLQDLKCSRFD